MKEARFWKAFETKVVEEGLKIYICENYNFDFFRLEAIDPFRVDLTFTSYSSKANRVGAEKEHILCQIVKINMIK